MRTCSFSCQYTRSIIDCTVFRRGTLSEEARPGSCGFGASRLAGLPLLGHSSNSRHIYAFPKWIGVDPAASVALAFTYRERVYGSGCVVTLWADAAWPVLDCSMHWNLWSSAHGHQIEEDPVAWVLSESCAHPSRSHELRDVAMGSTHQK